MTIAYVYKWTHISTMKWYVGSRVANGCHPDDGYICHSNYVKPMILESPTEWKREIISTGTPEDMYLLETEILRLVDAKNDTRSFNRHNNDGIYVSWGDKHPNKNPINAKKISDALTGIPKSKESIIKMSESLRLLGNSHPSKREDVRKSKQNKMLAKNGNHHQKTAEARNAAKHRVLGSKNPMYNKKPHNKLTNIKTPLGNFDSVMCASTAHGVSPRTMLRWLACPEKKEFIK